MALALERAGATMLACADIEEAIVLRRAGVRCEILVFGALGVSDVTGIFEYKLTPTISTPSAGKALQEAAARRGTTLKYHLKIDTGMNRLGLRHDNLPRTLPDLFASPNLELDAVYTHFATADDPDHPLMEEQRLRFEKVRAYLDTLGVRPRLVHAANSAALLRDSRVWYDLVRPGLLLYGVVPPPLASTIPLRPALSLRSRLVAVKHIRTGETVSYGARFTAERPTRVAVVPAGYADGIDLRMAGRGVVLVRGRRAHIVGAVCMDMILLDITDIEAYPGDEVVLLGTQGDERLDVREMAAVDRHHPVGECSAASAAASSASTRSDRRTPDQQDRLHGSDRWSDATVVVKSVPDPVKTLKNPWFLWRPRPSVEPYARRAARTRPSCPTRDDEPTTPCAAASGVRPCRRGRGRAA